jgi:cell division protein ZapA
MGNEILAPLPQTWTAFDLCYSPTSQIPGTKELAAWEGNGTRDLSATTPSHTEVRIFGATYHVRGSDDSGYLQALADLVDGKMREVAQNVATTDKARIAILAALNVADELFQARKRQEGERDEIKEKAAELVEELTQALKG